MWNALKSLLGAGEDPELVEAKRRTEMDRMDPRRRFVFGVLAISYQADPGYMVEHARTAVRDWYGISTRAELVERLEDYLRVSMSTPGYDAYRATFLARTGLPAALLNEGESWTWALAAARLVQRSYPGWREYGMGYLEGHLAYRQSQGDDAATVARYRQNLMVAIDKQSRDVWARTPFATAL
jgi:hypothetical protein